jgi:hypothetical protein
MSSLSCTSKSISMSVHNMSSMVPCMALGVLLHTDWHYVPDSTLKNWCIANLPVFQPPQCTCSAVAALRVCTSTSAISISEMLESDTSSPAGMWPHETATVLDW